MNNNKEEEKITTDINIFDFIDNDIDKVIEYINNNNGDLSVQDRLGNTPLHLAAKKGHYSIVQCLVANGALINIQNNLGYTPVHLAAEKAHATVVSYLIDNGADVNTQTILGETALLDISRAGHDTIAQLLIANGAGVNIQSIFKDTPLHKAARLGHYTIVKHLITNGAEVNIRCGISKETPVFFAASKGHDTIVQYLIANGATVNIKDYLDMTPLHVTTRCFYYGAENIPKYINIVKTLLPLTTINTIKDSYKLYTSRFNTEVEGNEGVMNKLIMDREYERYLTFCELFSVGTNAVEEDNNKQEVNSEMIGYDAPSEANEEEVRPFPPMFDSNKYESLFDATLAGEIWDYARDFLREEEINNYKDE